MRSRRTVFVDSKKGQNSVVVRDGPPRIGVGCAIAIASGASWEPPGSTAHHWCAGLNSYTKKSEMTIALLSYPRVSNKTTLRAAMMEAQQMCGEYTSSTTSLKPTSAHAK